MSIIPRRQSQDEFVILGVAVPPLSVTRDGQSRLARLIAADNCVGTGTFSHAKELHNFVILELQRIDHENDLGRIGIDEDKIRIKGIVYERRQGDGFIGAHGQAWDAVLELLAVNPVFGPDDAAEGPVLDIGG